MTFMYKNNLEDVAKHTEVFCCLQWAYGILQLSLPNKKTKARKNVSMNLKVRYPITSTKIYKFREWNSNIRISNY